jgi:hypothetical protein
MQVTAQVSSDSLVVKKNPESEIARNTIFAEVLGSGMYGSLNYERIIFISGSRFSVRGGGFLYLTTRNRKPLIHFSVPVELNYFLGTRKRYELGVGMTYANGFYSELDDNDNKLLSKSLYLALKGFGYRFQKPQGGFFLRLDIVTLLRLAELNKEYLKERRNDPNVWVLPGLSIGYTFKRNN